MNPNPPDPIRSAAVRDLIHTFIRERLDLKLDKLKSDDPKYEQERAELLAKHLPPAWLADAARRATQLKAVTHSLKGVHPDARGTSIFSPPASLPTRDVIGTHSLGEQFDSDVVGNAAALDVYKLLQRSINGQSLLSLAVAQSPDLANALSDSHAEAQSWMQGFASLAEPPPGIASHALAKQVMWPVGADVCDDLAFHQLSPLYPTSLVHHIHLHIQEEKFGDEAKLARIARKANLHHDRPVRDFPKLAVKKLGGTKPQNVSQLNSERGGRSVLFASLPPDWRDQGLQPPNGANAFMSSFQRKREVRLTLLRLRAALKGELRANLEHRQRIRGLVAELVDSFVTLTAEYRDLPSGWSTSPTCELPSAQKWWLDVDGQKQLAESRSEKFPGGVAQQILLAFSLWLNDQLERYGLPVGDDESREWRRALRSEIETELQAIEEFDHELA